MGRGNRQQSVDLHDIYLNRPNLYNAILVPLDGAVENRYVAVEGNFIYVLEAPGTLDAQVRFNETDAALLPLRHGRRYFIPFKGFYLTHSAQPGQTMTLLLGSGLAIDFSELGKIDINEILTPVAVSAIAAPVKIRGPDNLDAALSPVTITAAATQIVIARALRRGATFYNEGANDCRVGKGDVLFASKGLSLPAGATLTLYYTGAIYGICDAALTTEVSFVDEYTV